MHVMLASWGIPLQTVADLKRELIEAGFVDPSAHPRPGAMVVTAVRP